MNDPLTHLAKMLPDASLDLLVLNPGPGLLYLTGLSFHLMERPTLFLLDRDGRTGMVLPALEGSKVRKLHPDLRLWTYGDNPASWPGVIDAALGEFQPGASKVGVESARLRHLELAYLQQALPGASFQSADPLLSRLRARKNDAEVARMRKAVQIAELAFTAALPALKPGMSERAFAAELVLQLLRQGSDPELPFAPIVAGGPNSADPHAVPGERPFQPGDLVVIDWGASVEGYFSDLTRTVALGQPDPELIAIYQAVQGANQAGRLAGKPGVPAGEVDRAGRAVIEAAGYGKYFTHRIGHGLGLEAHEEPYMFAENGQLLETGNAYTVEPGIYLPGRGGVRIEDDLVVTQDGAESLSTLARDLILLPVNGA